MSSSSRPHGLQPTRHPRPWDSPGKNTGVGCHFLLQCMTVKSESEVAQSCLTLHDPMDCSLPGSSVRGIFQALPKAKLAPKRILTLKIYIHQRRRWHPTPVLLPGKPHGWASLVGCSPWGREELDTTELLHFHFSLSCIGEGNGNPLQCSCLENPRDRGA